MLDGTRPPRPSPTEPTIARNESQRLDQESLLYDVLRRVQRARSTERVAQEAVHGARSVVGADYCALLTGDGSASLHVRAWSGDPATVRGVVDGVPSWELEAADPRPRVIASSGPDTRADRQDNALSDRELAPLVAIPVLDRGRVVGELVAGRVADALTADEIRLLEVIGGHVALALWRARADEGRRELFRRFEAERSVLESVVKQMPAGVLLADVPSGRIITSNPQIAAIWGRTLRHTAGIADYAMWGGLDGDGQPLDPGRWPLARAVRDGETVRDQEIAIERSDGGRRTVVMSAGPVRDSEGRQLGAVATVIDVTGDREREGRQEYVERAALAMNASLSLDATLDAVVHAATGPSADWAVLYRVDGDDVRAVAATHRDPGRAAALRGVLAGDGDEGEGDGETEVHPVVRRVLREGAPVLLQDPARRPFDGAGRGGRLAAAVARFGGEALLVLPLECRGRDVGVLVAVRTAGRYAEPDVRSLTELVRHAALAMDNAARYEAALAADRAKANFLAVMSHEFRTPLSAILGYADILMTRVHGDLNAKQQTHLDRVKASVRHLTFLVDEILSFASMEAGRERVIRRRTGLAELVVEAASLMEPIAEAAGLTLTVTVPDEPVELETDPAKVRQIITNLLSNALKYTEEGAVRVTLEVDRDVAYCRVADTGPGIAPEHVEHVFEPFWQVDRSGPGVTGTGLGLAVSRRLARLLGGDVVLTSRVGRGSRFTFALPLTAPRPEAGGE